MLWKCERCGLGPITVKVLPVYHQCIEGGASDGGAYLACIHRGSQVGEHTCEQCGNRGVVEPVYKCLYVDEQGEKPHERCTLRRWTASERKMAGEAICLICPNRAAT